MAHKKSEPHPPAVTGNHRLSGRRARDSGSGIAFAPAPTRRRLVLLLPIALGLADISGAQKPEGGRDPEKEPRRREGERRPPGPWYSKPAFLTAIAAVIAAVGGIIAAIRRPSAKG